MTTPSHYREDLSYFLAHPECRYRVRRAQLTEAQIFEDTHGPCPADKVMYTIVFRASYDTFFGCCFATAKTPPDMIPNHHGRVLYEWLRDELVNAERRVTQ